MLIMDNIQMNCLLVLCQVIIILSYRVTLGVLFLALIGLALVFCSYLIFAYNPLQIILTKVLTLAPGTIFFNIWTSPPHDVYIKVYIFNVTNPKEFLEGTEKLTFNQIGPYTYKEMISNINATFNPNGTVSFYPRRHLRFVREKSVGDPVVDRLVSPNIPLLGITASLQEASMWTNLAVSSISNYLDSQAFLNITIHEYLWGYDDQLVTLANQAIPTWINFDRFGILDRLMALDNASNIVTITSDPTLGTSRNPLVTEEEKKALYHIVRFNGSPGLAHWGYTDTEGDEVVEGNTRCNNLEGAFEGTIFPSHLKENGSIRLYRRAFCRPVPVHYDGKGITKDGFEGFRYRVDKNFLATPEENPDNACYCRKSGCLKKGLGNLAPCYYDIPIAISQPHFLNSDPWLLEQVKGLSPNETLHDTTFYLHPDMGVPMDASLRIQINLDVGETKYNTRTEPFNGLVLPLFWLELTIEELPPFIVFIMRAVYNVLPVIQVVIMYLFGIFGLALISFSALYALFFNDKNKTSFLGNNYSPIPIIPLASQYFKPPEIRISK